MQRRTYLKAVTALAAGSVGALSAQAADAPPKGSIELYVDMKVDPKKEQQLLKHFKEVFRPTAAKQPGYIDVKLLKLRSALQGAAPSAGNYRFMISFTSEEARQKWIATDIHQKVWPAIENMLIDKNYTVMLYDIP